jgi:uncharacterized membrane protein
MPVVAGLAAFMVLVVARVLQVALADQKEEPLMIQNYGTVSNVLEVLLAVGTGYLAGGLPT